MKIGILGGGQLARMLAEAAIPLNIEIYCIEPKLNASAKKFAQVLHVAFSDTQAITDYFQDVHALTYETENLPIEWMQPLAKQFSLVPNLEVLRISQDRLYEKNLFHDLGIPTTKYVSVASWEDMKRAVEVLNFPLVLKTRRSGYDGKGQAVVQSWEDAEKSWNALGMHLLIAENFIAFDKEVSMIAVCSQLGDVRFYPLILNKHEQGILRVSEAPYEDESLRLVAEEYVKRILQRLNYVGVMTLEFFCRGSQLIANEIAPRVHNSGHWTIEGAETSQFENHIRAVAGLPLGSTKAKGMSRMINLIGGIEEGESFKNTPGAYWHWYDKEPMLNRKLGHITLCSLS